MKGLFMTIAKLVLMLVCLMSVTLEAKDVKVTPLFSKDLTDFPGKNPGNNSGSVKSSGQVLVNASKPDK
jgi:hypothetical protein